MDTMQTWSLLRPLIVFLIAGPAIAVAAILGLRRTRSDPAQRAGAQVDRSPRFALSISGVWRMHADRLSQSRSSDGAAPAAQKRAA